MKIDGACHCGAIAYEAELDPEKVAICHCDDCQALSGSAFRTVAPVRAEAFRAIRQHQPTAKFVLVGSGPAEQRLREAHSDALFAGPRIGEDLARHYASGDLFLFPSQTETFGNVTLEAMASGLAVVSYDLAAAHELIQHQHNGLLAADGDKAAFINQAVQCAADPDSRVTLGGHARDTALKQAWPTLIERLERLFLTVHREPGADTDEGTATSTERP